LKIVRRATPKPANSAMMTHPGSPVTTPSTVSTDRHPNQPVTAMIGVRIRPLRTTPSSVIRPRHSSLPRWVTSAGSVMPGPD
jgi:hypothetical protein